MIVTWTRTARQELRSGLKYIRDRNRPAADRIAGRMRRAVSRIARLPESGGPADGPRAGIRFVVVEPFVIYYILHRDDILIIRVRHGSQEGSTF